MASRKSGRISRVAGPVVTAEGVSPRMYDVVLVGELKLMGEVIKLVGDKTVIQVYEDTSGIRPGEAVVDTGAPLQVELGPGLLSSIYDGVQRPLPVLMAKQGDFVSRGVTAPGLDQVQEVEVQADREEGRRPPRRHGRGRGARGQHRPQGAPPAGGRREGHRHIRG